MDFSAKREKKDITISNIVMLYNLYSNGVPGMSKEVVAAQIDKKGNYLYETEVKEVIEKNNIADAKDFIEVLKLANAIKPGSPSAFGANKGSRATEERATGMGLQGDDVKQYVTLAKRLEADREAINKILVKVNHKWDFALKKVKKG